MQAARIKILEPSLRQYTGILCGAAFKDGVSVHELSFLEQQRICAAMRAETLSGDNVSPAGQLIDAHHKTADQAKREEVAAAPVTSLPRGDAAPAVTLPTFTREELEAVADAEGIRGLRQIGETVGVRGKTINALIDAILAQQGGAR